MFDQLITYQILLDMLYDRRMYGDVLRIYDEVKKRILAQNRYVSNAINAIVFATYYRLVGATHIQIHIRWLNHLQNRSQNYGNLFKFHIRLYVYICTEYADTR